jgi:flagellar M-ring protein FliF
VTVFEEIKPAAIPEPTSSEAAMSWLAQHWQTVGVLLLALISLVMLRSMIRSSVTPEGGDSLSQLFADQEEGEGEEGEGEEDEAEIEARLGRFARGAMSLQDEVAELVREDPDAAANILRTWIGAPANKPD